MADQIPERLKDPEAVLDYGVRWGVNGWLEDDETISSSTWTVEDGITKDDEGTSPDGKTSIVWLSGGIDGEDYLITNHVTTSKNREDDRSILIKVRQR